MDLAIKNNSSIIFTETEEMEGKGGNEVRRINVIYFLSRNGEIEQPHLFRIHHFTRNGVYLRDVKRWIAQLRGEDTAETFTWSYKRKYKQIGFVWQDLLLDKDLLTPISDNEYILKGTQISGTPIYDDISSFGEKDVTRRKMLPLLQSANKVLVKRPTDKEISCETEEENPRLNVKPFTVTYKDANSLDIVQHNMEYERYGNNTCFFSLRFSSKDKNRKNGIEIDNSTMNSSTWSSPRYSSRSTRTDSCNSSSMLHKNVSHRVANKENKVTSKRSRLSSVVGLFVPQQIIS